LISEPKLLTIRQNGSSSISRASAMRYAEFKAAILKHLQRGRHGATWLELRDALALPYERPCPEWTRQLEKEIGLIRRKGSGRSLVWELQTAQRQGKEIRKSS
jgi:hypothetical protein